jgi:hypothetical protein
VSEIRNYQRYAVSYDGDTTAQVEVIVEGELVRLQDFSLGGLFFLSKKPFSLGATLSLSVDLEKRGKIDLIGKVVRAKEEGDMWGIAIDLSQTYKLKTLRKV